MNKRPTTKEELLALFDMRREEILHTEDTLTVSGTAYYVSLDGDDANDGKTEKTAWRTLQRVTDAPLLAGDGVFFRRGDLFRGTLLAREGVTYAAFGKGEKPRIYTGERDLADPLLWERVCASPAIWRLTLPITDCGTLVFDGGERHARKLIPSYRDGCFVCRKEEDKPFLMENEMTSNLDIFHHYDAHLTEDPSRGESFPVPKMFVGCVGTLYLRCDEGNPGEVFSSIEAVPWAVAITVRDRANVHVDNLCIRYAMFGVAAAGESVRDLTVTNCEIGWIGGNIQSYLGDDPNYPEGGRGSVTRYGNGIEVYGGCDGFAVENCYIYECYDAGATHQVSTFGRHFEQKNILYRNNLIDSCVYGIEYFLEKNGGDTTSFIENCLIEGNLICRTGYGWGQQRHNKHTPAAIKGWSYENTARRFEVRDNVFDRSAYRLLHLVAREEESCPFLLGNTYAQDRGATLGQYGANREAEPPVLPFDEAAEGAIRTVWGDREANILSF